MNILILLKTSSFCFLILLFCKPYREENIIDLHSLFVRSEGKKAPTTTTFIYSPNLNIHPPPSFSLTATKSIYVPTSFVHTQIYKSHYYSLDIEMYFWLGLSILSISRLVIGLLSLILISHWLAIKDQIVLWQCNFLFLKKKSLFYFEFF